VPSNNNKLPNAQKNKNQDSNFEKDFNEIVSLVEEELNRNSNNSN
jgi:hypothetical protein